MSFEERAELFEEIARLLAEGPHAFVNRAQELRAAAVERNRINAKAVRRDD